MILETDRLILRPWNESDAESLYEYAKDPLVGPPAGWQPHSSIDESREVLKNILMADETYAVCRKKDGRPIGAISLMMQGASDLVQNAEEAELGYWIGVPFWGQGLIPEAGSELLRHAFEDLNREQIWCGYYDQNEKSARVQQKLGFIPQQVRENVHVPLMNEYRTLHIQRLTKEDWLKSRPSASDGR